MPNGERVLLRMASLRDRTGKVADDFSKKRYRRRAALTRSRRQACAAPAHRYAAGPPGGLSGRRSAPRPGRTVVPHPHARG